MLWLWGRRRCRREPLRGVVHPASTSTSPAQQPLDPSLNQHNSPLSPPDHHSPTCKFAPSLSLPTTFTSTLPSSLYNHLPSILNSHFISPFSLSLSSPTAPVITTLSLSDETGDPSLQGIYLGLVYTSHTFTLHSSAPVPPTTSTSEEQVQTPRHPISDPDKAWGSPGTGMEKNENPSVTPSPKKQKQKEKAREQAKLQCKQRRQEKLMKKCFGEAVDGVRERRLVEGTLEYPGERGKMRFLVWRVD
ncbi:hypothetical protein CJF31_00003525 [Rutstroemia sp. NJR-2017a BVV2]|nr:hypothetical protein CJF31_00003525 [Rutstroemia sp. NJR-2017a BVV2]